VLLCQRRCRAAAAAAAQVLGLADEVVDMCFKGTACRIGGVGFTQLAKDILALHEAAYLVGFVPCNSSITITLGTFMWPVLPLRGLFLSCSKPPVVIVWPVHWKGLAAVFWGAIHVLPRGREGCLPLD
jgi:hypothetical protein